MFKRLAIAVVLLAALGGGLVWFNFFRDRMIADFFANMPVQTVTVSTVTVEPVTWQPNISAIGTANASQGVDLTVEAAGVVRELSFSSNEEVEAGQLLLRLDDAVQVADLEAARTQVEQARTALARAEELQSRGVGTSVQLEEARAAFQSAEAQAARASALVEQRKVKAPFSGTIGLPRVDLGQYVSPGTSVATLQDLATMRVDFTLPEQQLPALAVGQKLRVRAEGVSQLFEGTISGIDPRVDPATRLVAVRGVVEAADSGLTPGQFVRIEVVLPEEEGVVALPQTAVVTSLYGDYVYAVRTPEGETEAAPAAAAPAEAEPAAEEGASEAEDADASEEAEAAAPPPLEVRQIFVTVGRRTGNEVEIVEGVAAGDVIVTAGQNRLSNGTRVAVDNTVNPGVEGSEEQASR